MSDLLSGWGRGSWGSGAWNQAGAVEVTGVVGTGAAGNIRIHCFQCDRGCWHKRSGSYNFRRL